MAAFQARDASEMKLAKCVAGEHGLAIMKGKAPLVVLSLACLALGVLLLLRHNKALEQKEADTATILVLSNTLVGTESKLQEQQRVNSSLETNLTVRIADLLTTSNRLVGVSAQLAKTEQDAQAAAKTAQEEMAKRDARINQLEGQNDELTRKMSGLNAQMTELEKQISETERKLAASEGDREFLTKELKRLQGEKLELERQFNDLAMLREQVRKLKDELSIARRLEWIRRGLYGFDSKNADKLQTGHANTNAGPNYDLNVEVRQDGGARVVPSTNAPAAK
jgi:septal ring factor EnvC (AmiA/AmiB activator)